MDFEKVHGIIAETLTCDVKKVTDNALLIDDLGADLAPSPWWSTLTNANPASGRWG